MSYKNMPYDFNLSLAENICKNRNVPMETILSPRACRIGAPTSLDNMDKAANLLLAHLKKKSKIYLQQDSDVDGLCSTAILYNYIQKAFPENAADFYIEIHPGKEHGLFPEQILNQGYALAIAPDASSSQFREHLELSEAGIDVLVLDHHETEKYSEHATVVNNQLSENYENKALCGAGVVWQFCRHLDEKLGHSFADDFVDLVAVALMGDMMDVREEETRFLVDSGLKSPNNYLLKEFFSKIESNPFSSGPLSGKDVSFSIAPLINSTIRVGSDETKRKLLEAVCTLGDSKTVKTTKRGGFGQEELSSQIIREMEACKRKQKTQVDKMVSAIDAQFSSTYKEDTVIVLPLDWEDVNSNLLGLMANIISNREQQPCVILRKRDGLHHSWTGSVRAYGVPEFKDMVSNLPSVGYAEGHQQACGIGILADDIEVFKGELRTVFTDVRPEITYLVDATVDLALEHNLESELAAVAELTHKRGNCFNEPLIELKNFRPTSENCSLVGQRKTVISFRLGFCMGSKLFTNELVYLDLMSNQFGTTSLYGHPYLNDSGGFSFNVVDYSHNYDFTQFVF